MNPRSTALMMEAKKPPEVVRNAKNVIKVKSEIDANCKIIRSIDHKKYGFTNNQNRF
jgi:hypothetical protein